MDLDDTSGVTNLDRSGDPSVEANTRPCVARSGLDPRGDAVEKFRGGRAPRLQFDGRKVDASLQR